jgi:hypothetical protein
LELGNSPRGFIFRQRFAVPSFLILNKRNTRAFQRSGKNNQRLLSQSNSCKHFQNFFDIVALYFFGSPTKGFKTPFVDVQVMTRTGRLALAQPVDVNQSNEIIEMIVARERCSFPDGTFGALTVPEEHVSPVIQLIQSSAKRHAYAHAQTLPE